MIIFVATGWTEATFAGEGNKMEVTTSGTAKHSSALRRIATGEHTVNVLHDRVSRTKKITDMFIVIGKN